MVIGEKYYIYLLPKFTHDLHLPQGKLSNFFVKNHYCNTAF
ncbi:hypothetical protein COO91_05012 [Nostoc flagelliforme CCNUN1]|uniref:Uncharacterized protein n=1 Tax=Nostoc flagelliforme CCNUN1 TaxID=2038116 RepID=A0A2K8SUK3_9NOSO|nr:hypothetical protein COO91_05012 [Nostoc flagelliforme CCNUN1]